MTLNTKTVTNGSFSWLDVRTEIKVPEFSEPRRAKFGIAYGNNFRGAGHPIFAAPMHRGLGPTVHNPIPVRAFLAPGFQI